MRHRELVLRCAPQLRLRLMALRTGLAADEGGDGSAQRAAGRPAAMHAQESETDCEYDERRDRCPDPDCAPRQRPGVVDARGGILRWLGVRHTDRPTDFFLGNLGLLRSGAWATPANPESIITASGYGFRLSPLSPDAPPARTARIATAATRPAFVKVPTLVSGSPCAGP